ncbi:hypothetical protein HAX54_033649 [Datura stramonium]|uniref:Uncharacterized protein n=1 Tax=Datura stramonium TaxID=4076 RepID=A0ABS8SDL3_DATST|nr:hypothetical protein [Datura stramonium]
MPMVDIEVVVLMLFNIMRTQDEDHPDRKRRKLVDTVDTSLMIDLEELKVPLLSTHKLRPLPLLPKIPLGPFLLQQQDQEDAIIAAIMKVSWKETSMIDISSINPNPMGMVEIESAITKTKAQQQLLYACTIHK